MRRNRWKMRRPGIALLLVLCMAAGMVPNAAFAAEMQDGNHDGVINYVSLGDSMTNGYGMPGYGHNGYLHNVPNTYPELLAEAYQWNHIPLAVSGMRAEDLQFVLEFPWDDDAALAVAERTPQMDGYTAATHGRNFAELWWNEIHAGKWYDTFASGDFYTWDQSVMQLRFNDSYYDVIAQNGKGYGAGVENVARMIQESVAGADVISLAVGNANFGVFMRSLVVNALAMMEGNPDANMWIDLDRVLNQCDAKTRAIVFQVREEVLNQAKINGLDAETAAGVVDAVTYTVASYLVSYEKIIQWIIACNPDAEVIILGLMNTLNGMEVRYQGQLIDLGQCMGAMIDVVNAYLTGVPAALQNSGAGADAKFYFASASEVNMWVEEYATVASSWEKYPVIRDRFITKVCDTLFPMVQRESWKPSTIARSDVEAFEAAVKAGNLAFAQYAQQNVSKAASVATYKAFENAIVQTYSMDAPDVTVLMDLENGMNAVVAEAMNIYAAKTEEKVAQYWNAVVADVVLPQLEQENATLEDALAYVEQNAQLKADLVEICTLLATPETLTEALIAEKVICDLLSLLARLEIGDGIGCHPSTEGHAMLADAVIGAYGSGHTAADATQDSIMEFLKTFLELVFEYGDDIYDYAEENGYFDEATKATYVLREDSWYTALGDATAASKSYVDQAAGELGIGYTNLASADQTIRNVFDVMEANQDTIAKSDLVTVGFGSNGFTGFALEQLVKQIDGETVELDWREYVGEEGLTYVEEARAELKKQMAQSGIGGKYMGIDLTELMVLAVESYAYAFISYSYNLPEVIKAVHALNPEALVVVVGMHNPLTDVVIELGGEKLAIGAYLQYLVDAANADILALAMMHDNVIYVAAPDVETHNQEKEMDALQFLVEFLNNKAAKLNPSEKGHTYIKDQILNALTVTVGGLLGDADNNGAVNTADALLVLQYYTGAVTAEKLNLENCDVDGINGINTMDALLMLKYYTGEIGAFPAER